MTLGELETRVLQRLDENATVPVYYPAAEVISALNEAQRFFVLLTLCLETTSTFALPPATAFFHMATTFKDWLLPLRVSTPAGIDIRPARLEDLDALDSTWQVTPGSPKRYAALGFDFLAIYPQPAAGGAVNITYARSPLALAAATDVPEIPEAYHPALADYAIYRLRMKEGGQEFVKTLPYFNRFLDEAAKLATYIRGRNIGSRYERGPFELERFDRSKLLNTRPDLLPVHQRS